MQRTRTLSATAALVAVLALLVTALAAPAPAVADRKPEHRATFDVKRVSDTDYVFFGKVKSFPQGRLVVLRKTNGAAAYAAWHSVDLAKNGSFRTRLTGDLGDCFRMRIPKADGYRTTTADLGCFVRR